jgi:hypothetical protein
MHHKKIASAQAANCSGIKNTSGLGFALGAGGVEGNESALVT